MNIVQQATAQTYGQMDKTHGKSALGQEAMTEVICLGPTTLTNPMVSPDIGFVDMLRYGIVALQLLPENSSAGTVIYFWCRLLLHQCTMGW